jgi:hypothetical protein
MSTVLNTDTPKALFSIPHTGLMKNPISKAKRWLSLVLAPLVSSWLKS